MLSKEDRILIGGFRAEREYGAMKKTKKKLVNCFRLSPAAVLRIGHFARARVLLSDP